jgi:hypothetical protein
MKYLIRFNTKHAGSPFVWRVLQDSNEFLVKGVRINVPTWDEQSIEGNETKWNIACLGTLTIENDIAYIEMNNDF